MEKIHVEYSHYGFTFTVMCHIEFLIKNFSAEYLAYLEYSSWILKENFCSVLLVRIKYANEGTL